MTLSAWFAFACTSWKSEEGQTIAEYGFVTLGIVVTLGLLAGASTAL